MELVITLIAHPEKAPLDSKLVTQLTNQLPESDTRWLSPNTACDVTLSAPDSNPISAIVKQTLTGHAIDAIIQPAATRRKKLLISDMDSTMITGECIDELADFVGQKDAVSQITERAMNGELDFAAALTERVALLKGLPEATLQQAYDERIMLMPGAKTLVTTMVKHGCHAVLVSGGFTFFTSRVRDALGFHADHANRLDIENHQLTGRVMQPILGKQAKLDTLQRLCAEQNIQTEEVLAIGDGANDLPMLQAAGLGVAYHAKPAVQAATSAHINHCDLSALLYVQGYGDEDFAA